VQSCYNGVHPDFWKQDNLHYNYLWPNIEWVAKTALERIEDDCPKVPDIGFGHEPCGK
jgi:hypothetical protein